MGADLLLLIKQPLPATRDCPACKPFFSETSAQTRLLCRKANSLVAALLLLVVLTQGARENIPLSAADAKAGQPALQPRSMADRAVRAAALQPLSSSRAELLGVQVDPHAAADCEDDGEYDQAQGGTAAAAQQQKAMARQSPGRALRSLRFGREQDASLAPTGRPDGRL